VSWEPLSLEGARSLFRDAPFRWWISGGQALELHLHRQWRDHHDLDIGVLRNQVDAVSRWLEEWDLVPAGVNNLWARRAVKEPFQFDLTIGEGNESEWFFRRNPTVARPWPSAVLFTSDGLPYLAPELQLLFKGRDPRPQDDHDAREVIPALTIEERNFLFEHIADNHPWRHF
jgi:hypothetical protein